MLYCRSFAAFFLVFLVLSTGSSDSLPNCTPDEFRDSLDLKCDKEAGTITVGINQFHETEIYTVYDRSYDVHLSFASTGPYEVFVRDANNVCVWGSGCDNSLNEFWQIENSFQAEATHREVTFYASSPVPIDVICSFRIGGCINFVCTSCAEFDCGGGKTPYCDGSAVVDCRVSLFSTAFVMSMIVLFLVCACFIIVYIIHSRGLFGKRRHRKRLQDTKLKKRKSPVRPREDPDCGSPDFQDQKKSSGSSRASRRSSRGTRSPSEHKSLPKLKRKSMELQATRLAQAKVKARIAKQQAAQALRQTAQKMLAHKESLSPHKHDSKPSSPNSKTTSSKTTSTLGVGPVTAVLQKWKRPTPPQEADSDGTLAEACLIPFDDESCSKEKFYE